MKKDNKSFADIAISVHAKYYRVRKPGDDKMTDEAFNREMQKLMQKQESVKQNLQFANQESPQESGGMEDYSPQNTEQLMYGIGGNLPKYGDGDFLFKRNNYNSAMVPTIRENLSSSLTPVVSNQIGQYGLNYGQQLAQSPTQLTIQQRPIENINDIEEYTPKPYSPTANILGPAASIGTSLISSLIRNQGLKNAEKNLMQYTNLGRVGAQQIDLGRERANLKSNAALSDAAGRYYSQGATSASEAANIQNQARLGSQRTLGEGLSRSYQAEETENARLRGVANMANQQIASDEAQMKLGVQSQFGQGARNNTWVDFAKSTGQSMASYLDENQRMKDFYTELNMMNPNYELEFQSKYNKLNPRQQRQARWGLRNPGYTKIIKDGQTAQ